MTELLFIIVFIFIGIPTFAQENGMMEEHASELVDTLQDVYREVMVDELPGEVIRAIGKNYPKANIEKAYWSQENMNYKLEIIKDDNTVEKLYLDREGKFEFKQ